MSNAANSKMNGQCLCGLIKYEVTKLEDRIGHCHCTMCRKFHGAAFATLGGARSQNFQWVSGEEHLKSFVASNGTTRKFCENCGSSLIFMSSNDTGELVEFSIGTLDTDIEIEPSAHIYTRFGANWYQISDSLPKFLEGSDGEEG